MTRCFTINVTNGNEAPTDLALSANTVAENSANGTVVGQLSAVDPDASDTATYSLVDNAGGRFAINGSNIVVAGALDYESATSHQVTVRVTDSAGNTYDEVFTINVTNVNEAPTDLALSADAVAENSANGTVVAPARRRSIPMRAILRPTRLVDNAGGRFAINGSNIVVAGAARLRERDLASGHGAGHRCSAGNTYDEVFTIDVTNVNEAPTRPCAVGRRASPRTAANGTRGRQLVGASIPDAAILRATRLIDNAGGRFAINGRPTPWSADRCSTTRSAASHQVTVQVTDAAGNTYDETFTINVTDVNEAPTDLALASDTRRREQRQRHRRRPARRRLDPMPAILRATRLVDNAGGRFADQRQQPRGGRRARLRERSLASGHRPGHRRRRQHL